jgi:hypothetical protein
MSWNYDPILTSTDEVRFLTADVDPNAKWTLQNEEIDAMLGLYSASPSVIGGNFLAAAVCAEAILGKFKFLTASKRVGDLSVNYENQFQVYTDLAYRLRQRAALQAVKPYVGGTSAAEKRALDADADRVAPAVKVDGMSYAKSIRQETDGTVGP